MELDDLVDRVHAVDVGSEVWHMAPLRLKDALLLLEAARAGQSAELATEQAVLEHARAIECVDARRAYLGAAYDKLLAEQRRPALALERYLNDWIGFSHALRLSRSRGGDPRALDEPSDLEQLGVAEAGATIVRLWTIMAGCWGNRPGRGA